MYCSVLFRYSTGKMPTEFRGNGTPKEQTSYVSQKDQSVNIKKQKVNLKTYFKLIMPGLCVVGGGEVTHPLAKLLH